MSDDKQPDKPDTPTRGKSGPLTETQRLNKQRRFLRMYRETANIKASCKYAGISRPTFYDWRDHDETFKAQLPDAEQDANDTLEFAAYDRAVNGVPSFVVSQGKLVYEEIPLFNEDGTPKLDKWGKPEYVRGKPIIERKFSDTLAITLLKARMPEKYKERAAVDHSGTIDITGARDSLLNKLTGITEEGEAHEARSSTPP